MAQVDMQIVLREVTDGAVVYEVIVETYIEPLYNRKKLNSTVYRKIKEELEVLRKKKKKKDKDQNGENDPSKVMPIAKQKASNPQFKHGKPSNPNRPLPSGENPPQHKQRPAPSFNHQEQRKDEHVYYNIELAEKLQKYKNKVWVLEDNIEKLEAQLRNKSDEANDLRNRLSKIAGDRLKKNNPNIADLSDPYRPTNLGKHFSELYDNEWSDAFEEIDKTLKNETDSVMALYETVLNTFKSCERKAKLQEEKMRGLLLDKEEGSDTADEEDRLLAGGENLHNILIEYRKKILPLSSVNVAKNYIDGTFRQFVSSYGLPDPGKKFVEFARKCAELCWRMHMCDPPMYMSAHNKGDGFDKTGYKEYTRSVKDLKQPVVEFYVWPILYLNVGGHMVCKGVAQPCEKGKKK